MSYRITIAAGCLFGFIAVSFGAFGAHALKALLIENGKTDVYELSVRYMMYHALALVFNGILTGANNNRLLRYSAVFFTFGIILFSGSLLALAILNLPALGMITPIGGLSLLMGWLLMLFSFIKKE